ncbi:kinase-like domain-containing protein [Boeremia exigua]|uniref:kinase-like domain-containing protein n=1 Tax=Boeremia exigua TaxID=749465 RepID=UPI001E8E8C3E|nr:kinase-like domain-containing protein [Boeremia exigua]KAH6644462.1 kinase-like domain-containing protein [Boeremia exigua]
MGTPRRISGSAAARLSCEEDSAEFQAISLIAQSLAHPQRTLLCTFVQQADDKEVAARFLLDEVEQNNVTLLELLADWTSLLRKVRPIVCETADTPLRQRVWQRDRGRCCLTHVRNGEKRDEDPLCIHPLPPTLFEDDDMAQDGKLHKLLAIYIGQSKLESLKTLLDPESHSDPTGQLMLMSSRMFDHFENGRLSLQAKRNSTNTLALYLPKKNFLIPSTQTVMCRNVKLENRAADSTSLPSPQIIEVHHCFAKALAWLEVSDYMKRVLLESQHKPPAKRSWFQRCMQPVSSVLQSLWPQAPAFLRAYTYKYLASLSHRLYARTGSDYVCRLPFNLYLRIAEERWAPRHQAELESLRILQKYTTIPAPRGVDAVRHSGSSYLLMTGVPGRGIGQMINSMTDKQLDLVAEDLKDYVAQLRCIPRNTASEFRICNPLGRGILDWSIGNSQREELRFRTVDAFHHYLAHDLPIRTGDQRKIVTDAHSKKHDCFFTHADLNLRNILVDETGRISGIVDWECAGWYPEYWEYTKMHFTVRSTLRWLYDVVNPIFPLYREELLFQDMSAGMVLSW